MSIYYPLYNWLCAQAANNISAPFKQIEAILGFSLPPSARTSPQWWENDRKHVQCMAWQGICRICKGVNLKPDGQRGSHLSVMGHANKPSHWATISPGIRMGPLNLRRERTCLEVVANDESSKIVVLSWLFIDS